MDDKPHIAIVHPSSLPADMFIDFEHKVRAKNLDLVIAAKDEDAFAGVEEWMPTLVMALIASHYFSGFLSEAGKSHYTHLEAGFKKLWRSLFSSEAPKVHVTSTTGKVAPDYEYSRLFSIYAEVQSKQLFKLLLPAQIEQEEFDLLISAYIAFLESYQAGTLDPDLAARIERAQSVGRTKLLAFNRSTQTIAPLHVRDD